jgi:hypothetical protein
VSLVSEALKKAQREAALREGRDKGLPEPLLAGAQLFRTRRRRRTLSLATAVAVIALAAAGALWVWRATSTPGPAPERHSVEGNPKAGAALEPASAVIAPAPSPTPAAPAPPAVAAASAALAAPPATAPSAAPSAPPPPSLEVSAGATAALAPASPSGAATPATETRPAATSHRAEPESFLRTAKLAGGAEIRLGGIAWSETAPLAYVNGKLVGVGEVVAGCAVRGIERESVSLDCEGLPVRVRLR